MDVKSLFDNGLGLFVVFCSLAGFACAAGAATFLIIWVFETTMNRLVRFAELTDAVVDFFRHREEFTKWRKAARK